MEKRNFVTSMRTSAESPSVDEMIDRAASGFGGGTCKQASSCEKGADFVKKASLEDEKSDKEHFGAL